MRPDTKPNPHAKRIMAGAAVLTTVALGIRAAAWLSTNYPLAARGALILACSTVVCYAVGTIGLTMAPGNDERGRP